MGVIFLVLLFILMFFMLEIFCWYFGKERRSDVLCVLFWLRGFDVDIEEECVVIEEILGKFDFLLGFLFWVFFYI